MATGSCGEQTPTEKERELGRDRSLRESQATVVSSSPMRPAIAFEFFFISTVKSFSQIFFTLSAVRPVTSATM